MVSVSRLLQLKNSKLLFSQIILVVLKNRLDKYGQAYKDYIKTLTVVHLTKSCENGGSEVKSLACLLNVEQAASKRGCASLF